MSADPYPAAAWIVPHFPWRGDQVSGVFFRRQAEALSAFGVPVYVIAPTPWVPPLLGRVRPRWQRYAEIPSTDNVGGTTVIRPRYPTLPRDRAIAAPDRAMAFAAWRWRRRWTPVDLLHGHVAIHGIATARLARRAGVPYLLTMHGSDVNTWPDQHPEWRTALVAAMRGAARVVAVSAALADRIRDLSGVDAIHLPIGIDHRAFRASAAGDRAALRSSAGIEDDAIVALFVGNLLRAKGIREFAAGVERAGPPVRGVAIGDGPERGSDGSVLWLGARSNDVVARWMAAADVVVLPSHGEGLPTVLVEAGSLGRPVIASQVGGNPELLASGRGFLLAEITADAVCAAIQSVARDPTPARRAGVRLQEFVEERYDVHRNAAALAELYRDVVRR